MSHCRPFGWARIPVALALGRFKTANLTKKARSPQTLVWGCKGIAAKLTEILVKNHNCVQKGTHHQQWVVSQLRLILQCHPFFSSSAARIPVRVGDLWNRANLIQPGAQCQNQLINH
jgi:hypothetical protein